MAKKYVNEKTYNSSWYSVTANSLIMTLGPLTGEINCDVCVVGGGFTGLSAALELSENGYSVVLLEAETLASGASGKNGGQLIRGLNNSPTVLAERYGQKTAKVLCDMTLEGLALILERISKHSIKCDLGFGHVTAALRPKHLDELKSDLDAWAKIGHTDLKLIDKNTTQSIIRSEKYIGGLFDPKGAHFHPLNYALGLARAAQAAKCKIHDESPVISIQDGDTVKVTTKNGHVNAKKVILGGYLEFKDHKTPSQKINAKIVAATAHMIATEPLGKDRAHEVLTQNIAVADANFVMNYFRVTTDYRVLFGGNCNYSGASPADQDDILRKKLVEIFPQLGTVGIDHFWSGPLDITLNRMPHIGKISDRIFFARGYCGHGIIMSNLAGKILADAVRGTMGKFDVFSQIHHHSFIGGQMLKRPLFALGMLWYRLKDRL